MSVYSTVTCRRSTHCLPRLMRRRQRKPTPFGNPWTRNSRLPPGTIVGLPLTRSAWGVRAYVTITGTWGGIECERKDQCPITASEVLWLCLRAERRRAARLSVPFAAKLSLGKSCHGNHVTVLLRGIMKGLCLRRRRETTVTIKRTLVYRRFPVQSIIFTCVGTPTGTNPRVCGSTPPACKDVL